MHIYSASKKKQIHWITIASLLGLIILLSLFISGTNHLTSGNAKEQEEILSHAVSQSITECYALEGYYPPSIKYLTDNYGLIYDSSQYMIDYQYIGANLRPDVTIIKRKTS
jgi:hypothetical protein